MEYDPEGFAEQLGDRLGMIEERIDGDLERYKRFLEARGRETGA